MGLQTSSFNTLIAGNTLGNRYDIYKIKNLTNFEYFKVYDLLEFSEKYFYYSNSYTKPRLI